MRTIAVILSTFLFFPMAFANGDAKKGQTKAAACAACHGADGNKALTPDYPKLAGQGAKYLEKQLKDFKSGARSNPVMSAQAAGLSDEDMADIAAFYSTLEVQYAAVPDKYIKLGESLYRAGDKITGVAACTACHGPQGNGVESAGFAAIGGQNPQYTIAQLKMFRDGSRNNDNAQMMRNIAAKLTDEQIEALAYYLVGLH